MIIQERRNMTVKEFIEYLQGFPPDNTIDNTRREIMYSGKVSKLVAEEFGDKPGTPVNINNHTKISRARELCAGEVVDLLVWHQLNYREAKFVLHIALGILKDRAVLQEGSGA